MWVKTFENALARSMQEAQSYRPAWYAGAGAMAFSPSRFTSDVGRSFSSAISAASTPSGSSSGSGGGGGGGWQKIKNHNTNLCYIFLYF